LYDELKNALKNKDSIETIIEVKNMAKKYYDLYYSNNIILNSFWYLRWNFYWKSIVLTLFLTNRYSKEDRDKFLFYFRRFYYLYWIAGYTLSKIKQISFNLIKYIKEGKDLDYILNEMENKLKKDNVIEKAKENILSPIVDNEPWIKPLLILVEYHYTDKDEYSFVYLDKHLHLEHILPQKYKEIKGWEHITKEIEEQYLHSIANLTLLSGKKNIEASNNNFETKLQIYQGKGKYNNKDEKITSFNITQKIVQDFKKWDEKSLEKRKEFILKEIEKILDIKLL
jgi:hypothetical protein